MDSYAAGAMLIRAVGVKHCELMLYYWSLLGVLSNIYLCSKQENKEQHSVESTGFSNTFFIVNLQL